MKLSFSFMPKDEKFFFLLHQSALNIQQVARSLHDLMLNFENVSAKVIEIKELEEFGDQIIHDITHSLHTTFVTPIDREDIMALAGRLDDVIDAIDEAASYQTLYTAGLPDPDLLIRCSGEMRLSNFLPWQMVYTEIYFTPVFWPDFRRHHLYEAVREFQRRQRRFGA